eukprot:TRINITY_DN88496_c0_g1_i1.p1 TRINITY_DN88496_c0_g1~~TRINITY_DN88496_c0_g1_i1.p1  ORF type:complete len:148 (+),score=17.16 TRINITY_DN88496_c0_g1_i1:45-488(+)
MDSPCQVWVSKKCLLWGQVQGAKVKVVELLMLSELLLLNLLLVSLPVVVLVFKRRLKKWALRRQPRQRPKTLQRQVAKQLVYDLSNEEQMTSYIQEVLADRDLTLSISNSIPASLISTVFEDKLYVIRAVSSGKCSAYIALCLCLES